MKVFLTVCVVLGIVAHVYQVNAVKCGDNSKCVKTEHTTETCENKVCKCVSGAFATDEGCVEKPAKPTVDVEANNNAESLENQKVLLTCTSPLAVTAYKWWVDGAAVTSATAKTFEADVTAADIKVKCSVTVGMESDPSDELVIKVLSGTAKSAAKPRIMLPAGVAVGEEYSPVCTGYPYGLGAGDVKLKDENDQALTVPITQAADKAGKKMKCTFEKDSLQFETTEAVLPKVVTSFESASITPSITEPRAYKVADAPTLTCQVSPIEKYLPAGMTITYKWSAGQATTKEWTPAAGEYDGLKCTAESASPKTSQESPALPKITVKDDYLAAPKVSANPPKPATTSQVSLTCDTEEKDVTFSWKKGSAVLPMQNDKTIQYGDIVKAQEGDFVCMITKDGFTAESSALALKVGDQLQKPAVTGPAEVGKWGEMKLTCSSESAVPAMTYTWAKDGKTIDKATEATFTVEEFEDKNAGKYKCTTKFAQLTEQTSDEMEVKLVAPGVQCTTDADCDGKQTSLTGKCDTKSKRCVCASKYYARGNECGNGVAQMAASLVVVLMAALVTRLM